MQSFQMIQIRQKVSEAIGIAITGMSVNMWLTLKMNKIEDKGDTLLIVGTYSYFNDKGSYSVTLKKSDLSIASYALT